MSESSVATKLSRPWLLGFAIFVGGAVCGSLATHQVQLNVWGGPGDHHADTWRALFYVAADGEGQLQSADEIKERLILAIHARTSTVAAHFDRARPESGRYWAQKISGLIEANPKLRTDTPEWLQADENRRCILEFADSPSAVVECSQHHARQDDAEQDNSRRLSLSD